MILRAANISHRRHGARLLGVGLTTALVRDDIGQVEMAARHLDKAESFWYLLLQSVYTKLSCSVMTVGGSNAGRTTRSFPGRPARPWHGGRENAADRLGAHRFGRRIVVGGRDHGLSRPHDPPGLLRQHHQVVSGRPAPFQQIRGRQSHHRQHRPGRSGAIPHLDARRSRGAVQPEVIRAAADDPEGVFRLAGRIGGDSQRSGGADRA